MSEVTCVICEVEISDVKMALRSNLNPNCICSKCLIRGVETVVGVAERATQGVGDSSREDEAPYRISEKSVLEMWRGVKRQAENQIDFLFANAEASNKKDAISKWIVVVGEDQVCFERFSDGVTLESYPPVTPAKAATYATAIVNGLQPPRDLRPCDKSVLEKAWPMTLEEFRAAANKPQEGGAREAFIKMETERANLLLKIQEEQESSLKSI